MEPLISELCGFQVFSINCFNIHSYYTIPFANIAVPNAPNWQFFQMLVMCWSSTHETHWKPVYALVRRNSPFRDVIEEYEDLEKISKTIGTL